MSVVPISTRRSRANGVGRQRPSLLPVPSGAPSPASLARHGSAARPTPLPTTRPSQAVATDRPLLGRSASRPRTGLFLMTTVLLLGLAELLLALFPMLRVMVWGIGILTALGAAAAGVAAAQGARGRGRTVWLLTGAAAGSILLGMLARGLPSIESASAPTFGRDDAGFVAAVLFFVLAATIRLDGERNGLRRARLLLDVVILSLSPAVFGLIVTTYTDVLGPREVLLAPGGLLYLSAYVATAYAMFWVTRRTAFARPSSPQGLLAWGTLGVSIGATLHAGQLLRLPLWDWGLGQPFWIVGLAGHRPRRADRGPGAGRGGRAQPAGGRLARRQPPADDPGLACRAAGVPRAGRPAADRSAAGRRAVRRHARRCRCCWWSGWC